MVDLYQDDIRKGKHDQPNKVDLSFKSVGSEESPERVIYDKNDRTGAKLVVLFNDGRFRRRMVHIDGLFYLGVKIPYNYANHLGNTEVGTLERIGLNSYIVTAPMPSPSSLGLLAYRGITVWSGGRMILNRTMENMQPVGDPQVMRCVYIYANRQNALGSLTPVSR